jgi:hypothetical protein
MVLDIPENEPAHSVGSSVGSHSASALTGHHLLYGSHMPVSPLDTSSAAALSPSRRVTVGVLAMDKKAK